MKEEREAVSARLLADRSVEAERRKEAQAGVDLSAQRELRADRAIVAGSQQSAAREEHESGAAARAERLIAEHPAQPLPQALVQIDALAKLRLEQENIIRELEAERTEGQSIKGQRMT